MTTMERRLMQMEKQLAALEAGPTHVAMLREARAAIIRRVRAGLPRPPRRIPTGDDPLSQRLRNAILKSEADDPS